MAARPRRYRTAPLYWRDRDEHLRKVAQNVNDLMRGRNNAHFEIELQADAVETTFQSDLITPQTCPLLSPRSAASAAALTSVWTEVRSGEMTIHHDSHSEPRSFGLFLVG